MNEWYDFVLAAYITGESGIIPENPIQIGHKMRNQVSQNEVDIEAEVNIALQSKEASQVASTPLMKELGLQRSYLNNILLCLLTVFFHYLISSPHLLN